MFKVSGRMVREVDFKESDRKQLFAIRSSDLVSGVDFNESGRMVF